MKRELCLLFHLPSRVSLNLCLCLCLSSFNTLGKQYTWLMLPLMLAYTLNISGWWVGKSLSLWSYRCDATEDHTNMKRGKLPKSSCGNISGIPIFHSMSPQPQCLTGILIPLLPSGLVIWESGVTAHLAYDSSMRIHKYTQEAGWPSNNGGTIADSYWKHFIHNESMLWFIMEVFLFGVLIAWDQHIL